MRKGKEKGERGTEERRKGKGKGKGERERRRGKEKGERERNSEWLRERRKEKGKGKGTGKGTGNMIVLWETLFTLKETGSFSSHKTWVGVSRRKTQFASNLRK